MLRMIGTRTIASALMLLSAGVNAADMFAEQAYLELNSTGSLGPDRDEQVVIKDSFELARLRESKDPLEFYKVRFEGGIDARSYRSTGPLMFRDSVISTFDATGAIWSSDLTFSRSTIRRALFQENVFHGKFVLVNSDIQRLLDFSRSIFDKSVQILGGSARRARFSGTRFMGPVAFDDLEFRERASFSFTVFESVVSFVETKSDGLVSFNRVFFNADAEFRRCAFHHLTFGVSDRVVFKGLADFRGCTFDTLVFEQTDFYGDVNFFGATFRSGGVHFKNVFMGGENTYFEGVTLNGPVTIESSFMPNLRFNWSEISAALMPSDPDTTTLNALQARSEELNRTDDASSLEYYAADKKRRDTWKSHETSFAEKAQAALEYAVWGSITGYGTKLDRALLIAMSFWLLGSLPLIVTKDKLYRVPASPRNSNSRLREFRFRPASVDALPSTARQSRSLFERILVTLGFSFALMFKIPISVRYVESDAKSIGMHPMERYLAILWVLGAFLLVLVGLTLAKTSPIVSKIVGELF